MPIMETAEPFDSGSFNRNNIRAVRIYEELLLLVLNAGNEGMIHNH
jgi:hypothetical protein